MKLKLKHIAPYLPYGLKIQHKWEKSRNKRSEPLTPFVKTLEGITLTTFFVGKKNFEYKPILRPLSNLTKEIEHNGKKFVPMKVLNKEVCPEPIKAVDGLIISVDSGGFIIPVHIGRMDYVFVEKMFEWHFDIFNLIEKGLAIDINTIKTK